MTKTPGRFRCRTRAEEGSVSTSEALFQEYRGGSLHAGLQITLGVGQMDLGAMVRVAGSNA